MRTFVPLAVLALVACGGEPEMEHPEIVSWTVTPAEAMPGEELTSTIELMHFELTGHDMGGTGTGMTGMTGMSADADDGHDHDHEHHH